MLLFNCYNVSLSLTHSSSPLVSPLSSVKKKKSRPVLQIWNLKQADIRAVIHTISQLTGKSFVISPSVEGKVTMISKKPMTVDELYSVFLSMLQVLNYAAIPSGHVVKIVPAMDAKEYGAMLATKKHPGLGDEVVLRVVTVNNVSAMQLVPILRPLMKNSSTIMAYNPSNALILAGSAFNVERMVEIIEQIDRNNANKVHMVKLRYASAKSLAKILGKLQSSNRSEGKISNVSYAADEENNSILISGNELNLQKSIQLIHHLDTKGSLGEGHIEVVHLKYLLAKEMVPILTRLAHGKISDLSGISSGDSVNNPHDSSTETSLSNLSGGNAQVEIVAEKNSNALIISAPADMMRNLNHVIQQLDVRPMQVLVEAIIVTVNESVVDQLGIKWGTMTQGSTGESGTITPSVFQPGIGFIRDLSIKGLLDALKTNSGTDVLATPSVVVLNNQKASISDGVNIGIQNRTYAASTDSTSSSVDTGVPFQTTERKDVALKLTVTPQISPNNTVMMKIDQSNQQLDPTNGSGDNPTIDTSEIKTGVLVNSGDILVLGGLIRNDKKDHYVRIPILGDIPLLGQLFTFKDNSRDKKNLMIFLKPIILNSKNANHEATLAQYNYMRFEQITKASGHSLLRLHPPLLPPLTPARQLMLPTPH